MRRYRIKQREDGHWIIVNARDEGLAMDERALGWSRTGRGARLISFSDHAAAAEYARELFREQEVTP